MASAAEPQSLAPYERADEQEDDDTSATFNHPLLHSNNISNSSCNNNRHTSPAAFIISSLEQVSAPDLEASDLMRFLELLNSDDQQLIHPDGVNYTTDAFNIFSSPESAPHNYINDLAYCHSPPPSNIMNPQTSQCTAVCHRGEYSGRENIPPVHNPPVSNSNTNSPMEEGGSEHATISTQYGQSDIEQDYINAKSNSHNQLSFLLHGEQHGPTREMTLPKSKSVLHHVKHKSHAQFKYEMLFNNLNLHERPRSKSSRHNPLSTSSKRPSIGPYGRSNAYTELRDTSQHCCGGDSKALKSLNFEKLCKHKNQNLTLLSSKMSQLASNTHVDDHTIIANADQLQHSSADHNDKRGKRSASKNLDYERQRRKKINDSLYALRAVVPNISKMDKASIVSDAIDYVQSLEKQLMNIDEEIQALELWGSNVHKNFSRGLQPTMSSLICSQIEHKILRIDVTKVEEKVYRLEVICANGQGVIENLTKALEALGIDILYASLRTLNDLIFNNIFIEVGKGVKLQPTELRDIILRVAFIFGLGLAQDEVQVGSLLASYLS